MIETDRAHPGVSAALERYGARERINHWLLALAFILAALSGLALFHPALFGLTGLFGGGPWTRILHPFLGLLMFALFALFAVGVRSHNHMTAADWAWVKQIGDVVAGREDRLPEVGRYNAGQKLFFHTALVCLLVLFVSGIFIWRAYFSSYFPIVTIRLGALLHALFAFLLVAALIVHVYAAIWVKGSIRAMTRGTVTPGWAFRHHRAWYREMISHATSSRARPD